MAVTGTLTNHFKYKKDRGQINYKAQLTGSMTFTDGTKKITCPSSAITAGFEVGDRFYSTSTQANNKGPFIVKSISGVGDVDIEVMTLAGAAPTLTGETAAMTIGTYLIEVRLTRSGFTFNKDSHATLSNIKADTTATTLDAVNGTNKFTRGSGSFVTDGFVTLNRITASGFGAPVDGTYTISTVSALEIVVTEDGTGVMADITGGGNEQLIADDELATGGGYTQGAKLTGVITMSEDDANDRSENTFPTVTWTASGGDIGPTPSALLVNRATTDDTIIGEINFGVEETASTGTTFNIAGGTLRGI
jgi:hypothetical protein